MWHSEIVTSTDAPPEALRDRRRRLVRDEIERIAIRMFLDRGVDSVSVEDIATAAGMSGRTFFRYYASKDDILRGYQRGLTDALVIAFESQPAGTGAVQALRAAYAETSHVDPAERTRVRALGRLLATAPAVHARSVGEAVLDDRIEREFARRARTRRTDPRPAVLAAAVAAAASVAWNTWVSRDDSRDPAIVVTAAIDLLGLAEPRHARA
jgi:AcrR family transcriptional regulator